MLAFPRAQRWAVLLGAIVLALLPLTAGAAGPAQTPLSFRTLGVAEGLPHISVYDVVRDQFGFMWLGTLEGLARYDGYRFTVYRPDPLDPNTPSSGQIYCLFADREGVIWIGTLASGLDSYDPRTERFTHYRHDPADPSSLSSDAVHEIYEDSAGTLWVGTLSGGLNRLDRATGRFTTYRHDPADPSSLSHNRVEDVLEDGQGGLWVATFGGLDRLDPATGRFTHYRHDPADPGGLGGDEVYALLRDSAGALWVGVYGAGLYRLDQAGGRFTAYRNDPSDPSSLSSDNVLALAEPDPGELWVGTYGGGLSRLDVASGRVTQFRATSSSEKGFPSDNIEMIFPTADGLLWVGTEDRGVVVVDRRPSPFVIQRAAPADQARPDMLRPGAIRAVVEDRDGTLWLGVTTAGLEHLDRASGVVTHYQHSPSDPTSPVSNRPQALLIDSDGALWIGYLGGLDRLDRATGHFIHYRIDPENLDSLSRSNVFDLHESRDGALWIANRGGGLSRLDRASGRFTYYRHDPDNPASLSSDNVVAVAEDQRGDIWAGTEDAGLSRLDPATGRFTHYPHDPDAPTSPGSNTIPVLYVDDSGTLWASAWNSGLDRFDPASGGFAHYRVADGLLSGKINGIQPDAAGNLWLTSNQGLMQFDPKSGASVHYTSVSANLLPGGFPINGSARTSSGAILLGAFDGLVTFFPEQVQPRGEVAPVVISSFMLANQPVSIGETSVLTTAINATSALMLSYRDRVISFEFAALDFRYPQAIRYRYQLVGFDQDWVEVDSTHRVATYTNLDPGSYSFRVQAANGDGVWGTEMRSIGITVTPPWWQTWWFVLLAGITTVAGGIGAVRLRLYNLRARQRYLEAEVAARSTELREANTKLTTAHTELERQVQIERELIMTNDLDLLLGRILEQVAQVIDFSTAVIFTLDSDMLELRAIRSSYLQRTPHPLQLELKRMPLLAQAVQSCETQVFAEPGADSAMMAYIGEGFGQRLRGRIWLVVPLLVQGQLIGLIILAHSTPNAYSEADARRIEAFTNPVAIALENARLHKRAQRAAVLEERTHLARELHDAVTQTLFSATLIADALPEALQRSPERAAQGAVELRRLTSGALAEMRTLLLELRPKALTEKPLGQLLQLLCTSLTSRAAIPVIIEVARDCTFDPPVQLVFYRVAQEALNNVAKHAEAHEIAISFDCSQVEATLRVTDDGRGFDPEHVRPDALGLGIMRERAAAIGAQLIITSEPGEGTSLMLRWRNPAAPR